MKKRLTLIDLDTLLFIIAYNQYSKLNNIDDEEAVRNNVREYISTIQLNCKADLTSMVYQDNGHSNFRKYFYSDYKSNRPELPESVKKWKDTIINEYSSLGAVGIKVIESDDVLNIGYYKFKDMYDVIVVSGDKDQNQTPGEHYNPRTNKLFSCSNEEALLSLYTQILMGDSTDGIQGIPGTGPKTAAKLLELNQNVYQYTEICHKAYQNYFKDTWYSEYLKTKFLVTMLRDVDYNLYPFCNENKTLFNIKPVDTFMITNLFN